MESKYQKEKINAESNENQTTLLRQQNDQLQVELSKLRRENNDLRQSIAYSNPNNANVSNSEWEKRYRQLEQNYQELLRNSAQEAKNYQVQLQQKDAQLSQMRGNPSQTQVTVNNQFPNNTYNPNNPGASNNYNPNNLQNANNTAPNNPQNMNNTVPNNLPANQRAAINNPDDLLNLQSKLQQVLAAFSSQEAQVIAEGDQLTIHLSDSQLYQTNLQGEYEVSSRGQQILSTVANFALSNPILMLLVEGRGQPADGNNMRYLKSKAFANYMNTTGVNYRFHEKNNVPLAFNTSGTENRVAETVIFLSSTKP